MRLQQNIAFVQGDEADDVLDVLTRGGAGPNDWTVAAVIRWLTEGIDVEPGEPWLPVTENDREQVTERPIDGDPDVRYRLVWHEGLRYVGLSYVRGADYSEGIKIVEVWIAPGDEGCQYTLVLPDGRTALIGDAQDAYSELAGIIDDAFDDDEDQ